MDVTRTWNRISRRFSSERAADFWQLVDRRDVEECWPWTGCKNAYGYGQFTLRGVPGPIGAHRVAYGLTNGGIPGRLHVLHHCDNRDCCNPAHLFAGTHTDNMKDMMEKGRAGWQLYDECGCGRSKTKVSSCCIECAGIRSRKRKQLNLETRRRTGAVRRLEKLWQIAIRCPATRSELLDALDGDTRRAEVLIYCLGLYHERPLTMTQIGKRLGLTRERVRQIRNEALMTLGLDGCVPVGLMSGVRTERAA